MAVAGARAEDVEKLSRKRNSFEGAQRQARMGLSSAKPERRFRRGGRRSREGRPRRPESATRVVTITCT